MKIFVKIGEMIIITEMTKKFSCFIENNKIQTSTKNISESNFMMIK